MQRLHIVGRKGHGKTTLILELVRELTRLGYRVGTIKHTRHPHDLDKPGSDSYRHRAGGGAPAAIMVGNLVGVFLPVDPDSDGYESLESLYADCDIVLVEGNLDADGPKVEVWRAALGTPCLAAERTDIAAVVSDDLSPDGVPMIRRSDLAGLLEHVLDLAPARLGGAWF